MHICLDVPEATKMKKPYFNKKEERQGNKTFVENIKRKSLKGPKAFT